MAEPVSFTFDLSGLHALAALYPEVVAQETSAVMQGIVSRMEHEVVSLTPKGVGGAAGLQGSIFGEVQFQGAEVVGNVGSPLAHAAPVEYGTKPHYPPFGPLYRWVQHQLGLTGNEAISRTIYIQRKIARVGTKGKYMFTKALKKMEPWIQTELDTIPARVARRLNHV